MQRLSDLTPRSGAESARQPGCAAERFSRAACSTISTTRIRLTMPLDRPKLENCSSALAWHATQAVRETSLPIRARSAPKFPRCPSSRATAWLHGAAWRELGLRDDAVGQHTGFITSKTTTSVLSRAPDSTGRGKGLASAWVAAAERFLPIRRRAPSVGAIRSGTHFAKAAGQMEREH